MTEHSCPFAFGGLTNCFDKNKITPIVVRNVTTQSYVDSNVNISPQTIMNRYNYGTYLLLFNPLLFRKWIVFNFVVNPQIMQY